VIDAVTGCVVTKGAVQALPIRRLPLPVAESLGTLAFVAATLNEVVPAAAAAVVAIVRVAVFEVSAAAKLTALGLKDALAPEGSPLAVRFALNVVPAAPFRLTVTWYVALPAVPLVSAPLCPATETDPTSFATTRTALPVIGEVAPP
jgi:hypothetical protein